MTMNKQADVRDTEVVNSIYLLELTINNKGIRHHEISHRLAFSSIVVMKALGKIVRNYEVFVPKKMRNLQAIIFLWHSMDSITMVIGKLLEDMSG